MQNLEPLQPYLIVVNIVSAGFVIGHECMQLNEIWNILANLYLCNSNDLFLVYLDLCSHILYRTTAPCSG